MSNLKSLRNRIKSVKSTKKITSAMKMISASKLKKSQDRVANARPYAMYMTQIINNIGKHYNKYQETPCLLRGTGKRNNIIIIVATSNRGLCGSFNSSIVRQTRQLIREHQQAGRSVKLYCIGSKGYDQLQRDYSSIIMDVQKNYSEIDYDFVKSITNNLIDQYLDHQFDECYIIFNKFVSALNQQVTIKQLIPARFSEIYEDEKDQPVTEKVTPYTIYEYEPSEEYVLQALLPKNITTQIFVSLLENYASEQGARMAAMEGATRNAEDMIRKLSLLYNRTRQSYITNELIEIVSGANAL